MKLLKPTRYLPHSHFKTNYLEVYDGNIKKLVLFGNKCHVKKMSN